jgi:hypothetical protein
VAGIQPDVRYAPMAPRDITDEVHAGLEDIATPFITRLTQ